MNMERLCFNCIYKGVPIYKKPCRDCALNSDKPNWKAEGQAQTESEAVNHPSHYNQGKFECIEVMLETFGKEATKNFCLLNAFKYIWRAGEKNGIEDIKKASWYLEKFLELEGETNE